MKGEQTARHRLEDLPGLKPEYVWRLRTAGLSTVESLLRCARSPRDRMFLAARTGLTARQILEILNLADISRIDGLSYEAIQVLRLHGVHAAKDLAALDPAYVADMLTDDDRLADENPDILQQVSSWIAQARALPSLVD